MRRGDLTDENSGIGWSRCPQSNAGCTGSSATAVATRYDGLAVRYEVTVLIGAINEWL
ncbi:MULTISPECIES: hypothetical protein [Streptomyces]|uniref:hypothetical protein n=1 Tax=Streptomyces TaxID=1883 RepID=UPI00025CD772|nr:MULTISPECIES: hypothetical protein [Streptomyces]EIF90393.1 transposase [Streptomyces tsukubensis NRRL18488]